jgi:predicted neutral ceramidase superfamily lipid hydrolase
MTEKAVNMIYAIIETILAIVMTVLFGATINLSVPMKEKIFNAFLCLLVWVNAIAVWILKVG